MSKSVAVNVSSTSSTSTSSTTSHPPLSVTPFVHAGSKSIVDPSLPLAADRVSGAVDRSSSSDAATQAAAAALAEKEKMRKIQAAEAENERTQKQGIADYNNRQKEAREKESRERAAAQGAKEKEEAKVFAREKARAEEEERLREIAVAAASTQSAAAAFDVTANQGGRTVKTESAMTATNLFNSNNNNNNSNTIKIDTGSSSVLTKTENETDASLMRMLQQMLHTQAQMADTIARQNEKLNSFMMTSSASSTSGTLSPIDTPTVNFKYENRERGPPASHVKAELGSVLSLSAKPKTRQNKEEDEEEKIRRKDKRDDEEEQEIYEQEDENETVFDSYVKWYEQVTVIFPYEKNKKNTIYTERYTLLSPAGRMFEYMRLLFRLRGDERFFPRSTTAWYKYKVASWLNIPTKYRNSSVQGIVVPAMSYSIDDVRLKQVKYGDPDLEVFCKTWSNLPGDLQANLYGEMNVGTAPMAIDAYAERFWKKRLIYSNASRDRVPKEQAQTEIPDESFYCNKCGVLVTDPSRVYKNKCSECERKMKEAAQNARMPALEREDSNNTPYQVKMKIKKEQETQAEEANMRQHSSATIAEMSTSVLGKVLVTIFRPDMIQRMKMTKETDVYTLKELRRLVDTATTTLKHFDGDRNKAPKWIFDYCAMVYRYSLSRPMCIDILSRCFIKEAQSWLVQNLSQVSYLDVSVQIEQLVLRFVGYFMSNVQKERWRTTLIQLKFSPVNMTIATLKQHYETFITISANLQLCDSSFTDEQVRGMFVNSLPSFIRQYMGTDSERATSVDELMQMSEQSLASRTPATAQHGELAKTTGTRAIGETVHTNAVQTTEQRNQVRVVCFHCGGKGHHTGACKYIDEPQLLAGKRAWAERNEKKGRQYDYDKGYFVGLEHHIQSGQQYSTYRYDNNAPLPPLPLPSSASSSSANPIGGGNGGSRHRNSAGDGKNKIKKNKKAAAIDVEADEE